MLNFLFLIVAICLGILNYFEIAVVIAFIMMIANDLIVCYNTRNESELWL